MCILLFCVTKLTPKGPSTSKNPFSINTYNSFKFSLTDQNIVNDQKNIQQSGKAVLKRDIYYLIFDQYSREDILKSGYWNIKEKPVDELISKNNNLYYRIKGVLYDLFENGFLQA